jgi:hypothetical protein
VKLIDSTPADAFGLPADFVNAEVARHTEWDIQMDRQAALHLLVTSLAQVIADDIAAGELAYGPTVARYVYARDAYRAIVAEHAAGQ